MKVEGQLLPSEALAPTYDKAVWVYVYRTFKKDEADRAAERISLRFGVTSWPQMFLADPLTMEILEHTGRSEESFLAAMNKVSLPERSTVTADNRLPQAEARAIALETKARVKDARAGIDDEDIVVRTRALEVLADKEPKAVVKRASELLAVPNDPFRFAVCQVLAKAADPKAAAALEALVAEPTDSLNPNVLRIRAVGALATCGNARSVSVIAPHAASGAYFNGLTKTAIDALVQIAERDKKARKPVRAVLVSAYPPPPDPADERAMRACVSLARRVHKALDSKLRFPDVYDEAARARLRAQKP